MGDVSQLQLLLLVFSAIIAGVVDTLAGGGGLIVAPSLLSVGVPPIVALGTTKFQGCVCELTATLAFRKKKTFRWCEIKRGLVFTLAGSFAGTALLQVIDTAILKKMVPFLLLAVFLFHFFSKVKSLEPVSCSEKKGLLKRLVPLGLAVGFYNGFFGPGTGTIWTVAIRKFLRRDLREATMMAKPLNLTGNLTALTIFFATGRINLWVGLLMGLGALTGGLIGAHLVMYKDSKWLHFVFSTLMGACVLGAFKSL